MSDKDITPEPEWKKLLKKVSTTHGVLIIITFLFLSGSWYFVHPVDNTQYLNSTDPGALPMQRSAVIDDNGAIHSDYKTILLYESNEKVPAGTIPWWFLLAFFIYILITVYIEATKEIEVDFISDEEARHIIIRRWNYWKSHDLVKGELNLYNPFPQHHLRTNEQDGKKKAYEYIIPGLIIEPDQHQHWINFGVNPYNKKIYMMARTTKDFSRADLCPNCGDYSDTKTITTDDYQKLLDFSKGIKK